MDKPVEFIDKRPTYTAAFARSSKAIGVLWGVFSICFAIISVVIFIQPQWIGDAQLSQGTGFFGLWQHCTIESGSDRLHCVGDLTDLSSIISTPFKIATILAALCFAATAISICCFLLFFFVSPAIVFNICGCLQLLSAAFLLISVCIYPMGFDSPQVAKVCGNTARAYNVGECELRWAYLLAILGVLDAAGLCALAFILASRSKKLKKHIILQTQPISEPLYHSGSIYKGGHVNPDYINDGMSLSSSRKSLNLQPVLMMPRPDHEAYSDFPPPRPKQPPFRTHY